jgi:transcriptional regulator with XRE-family HTH domain
VAAHRAAAEAVPRQPVLGHRMKIDTERMLKARRARSWSQEELAIASGLNLRTVQRIERDGAASLQSRKALAAALECDVQDLEREEKRMPQQWDYRVIEVKDRKILQGELDKAGADGWELVSATSMFNTMMTSVVHTLSLKRARG